jgi:hypothetical protein
MQRKPKRRKKPAGVAERVAKYRASMRAAGMRPIQIWVPDTTAPGFAEECRRQSKLIANDHAHEKEIMDWIEQVADREGWEWDA